jgi:hypothetical protein
MYVTDEEALIEDGKAVPSNSDGHPEPTPMPEIVIDVPYLIRLSGDYEDICTKEVERTIDVGLLEEMLATTEARVLIEAKEAGQIDGKNARARQLQETQVLEQSEAVAEIRDDLTEHREMLAMTKARKAGLDAKIGLIKAWLYSQSGAR